MNLKRSTAGGLAGVFAGLAQYLVVPPTVIQELLLKAFGWDVSVDLAAFLGTAVVGLCGWAATEFQRDKTVTEEKQAIVDLAVTDRAQEAASKVVG